jgi:hypothetical protein
MQASFWTAGKCVRVYGRQVKQVDKKYFYGFGKQKAA